NGKSINESTQSRIKDQAEIGLKYAIKVAHHYE
ncbi:MAG: hypothetical protein ACI8T1_003489, partial [Verrucomicrobiales bacterium]